MKKVLLVIIITLLFVGCKKSHEDIIKGEFKKYIQDNFDDPNDFKEVVSIEIKDTVSSGKLLGILKDFYNLNLEIKKDDSVSHKELFELSGNENINRDIRNKATNSEMENFIFSPINKNIEIATLLLNREDINCADNEVKQIIDSFKSEPTYYIYKLKYRRKHGDKTTIHEISSHIDSATLKVNFYEKNKPLTDYQKKIFEKLDLLKELISLRTQEIKNIQEFKSGFEQLSGKYHKK